MARVLWALLRWSFRGPRLRTTGFLTLTFLVILTTNLYLLNRNDSGINGMRSNLEDHKRIVRDHNSDTQGLIDDNDEHYLLNKMKNLKDKLRKTRSRIFMQKQFLKEMTQHRENLEQVISENKLKRHLMNADGQEKSVPSVTTQVQHQDKLKSSTNFTFLYKFIFSKQSSSFLSCQNLPQNLNVLETLGTGYTKKVMKANIEGKYVALKQANRRGHDGTECVQYGMEVKDCYRLANYKVLKELALLQQLKSPHIIKVSSFHKLTYY